MAFVKQVNVRPISESADIGKVGLPKMSVLEAKVTKQGVGDDYNHYRFVAKKNTPNRAVLIFTTDILEQLNNEGWPVNAGDLGENITIEGLAYAKIAVGTKISVGEITIEVTEKADPCKNLFALSYIGNEKRKEFLKTMKNRRGWYARVLTEGMIKVNDEIKLI